MIILIIIVMIEATLTSLLPYSKGYFFDSLETRIAIYTFLIYYFINSFGIDLVQSCKGFFVTRYSLHKRGQHTETVLNRDTPAKVDNIPQRIQEDIKLMYVNRYTVILEYWISSLILVVIIGSNITQYWLISGALCYAAITIGLAYLFNSRLCKAEKAVQNEEANFRTNHNLLKFLHIANKASLFSAKVKLEYTVFTRLQSSIVLVLPFIILLPPYLSGMISFGDLIKISTMFQLIVVNANIMITMYPQLIQGKASQERVEEI